MNGYTFKEIVLKAKNIKKNVETEYRLGEGSGWCYYICKAILKPNTPIGKVTVRSPDRFDNGEYMSRQILKKTYLDMAERLVKYVENHHKMPEYVSADGHHMKVADYCYMFSRILVYQYNHKSYPSYANVNSKAFTKPTENKNTVFKKWVSKFKFTPKYIDDVCDYIEVHFDYQKYFDDHKSNAETIEDEAGNCTDLLQMLINIAEALGYEWKVYHVECNQSGTGHVYGMFRKDGVNNGNWFIRDPACIADESRYCTWCEAGNGGSLLSVNPNWFLQNLRR